MATFRQYLRHVFGKKQTPSSPGVPRRPSFMPCWAIIEYEPGDWFSCVMLEYDIHIFGPYLSRTEANDTVTIYQQTHKRFMAEHEERKQLYWAMRSRLLTTAEMEKVKTYGYRLIVFESSSVTPLLESKFHDALLLQHKIRLASEESELRRMFIRTGISQPEAEILATMKEYMS